VVGGRMAHACAQGGAFAVRPSDPDMDGRGAAGFQFAHSKLASYVLPLFPAVALVVGGYLQGALFERRTRLARGMLWLVCAMIVVAPVGLFVAARRYPQYIVHPQQLYIATAGFWALAGVMGWALVRHRLRVAVVAMMSVYVVIFGSVALVHRDIEAYISCRQVGSYLTAHLARVKRPCSVPACTCAGYAIGRNAPWRYSMSTANHFSASTR